MQDLERFHKSFRWNVSGSIIFELLKLMHNVLLLHLLSPLMYGTVGSLFAIIYLASRIIESGTAYTIPPFFRRLTLSKKSFKNKFLGYYIIPLFPLGAIVSTITTIIYFKAFSSSHNIFIFLIPMLMILEAARSIMRQLLHTAFRSRQVIFSELGLFMGYLLAVWGGFFIFSLQLSLNYLFIPYLVDSIAGISMFGWLAYSYYKKLPNDNCQQVESFSAKSFLLLRTYNFLLKASKDLFTSNFITPLFAIKFGLVDAGIFYFASTIATAVQAIIKTSIGYSGSALLANLKDSTIQDKRRAFRELSQKLMLIITPLVIFIGINHTNILKLGTINGFTKTTISFALLYLLIAFSEFFFLLYEQFYIVEEASKRLFYFKAFEFALLISVILFVKPETPIAMLMYIIVVRIISFVIIAINAFMTWKIIPSFRIKTKYVLGCLLITFLSLVLFYLVCF